MTSKSSYILLLVSLSFPIVLCKHDYFQYYSKYIKGVSTAKSISSTSGVSALETSSSEGTSTTEVISSSTSSAILSTDEIFYSNTGGSLSVEVASSEDNNNTRVNKNVTVLQGNRHQNNAQYVFVERISIIVGSVILFVVLLACIVCCCPACCHGQKRRGFVVRENREERVFPQSIIPQIPQQPTVVQHMPPQYMQEPMQQFPPQYPQQPMPPQSQYAPVLPGYQYSPNAPQYCNLPEAPPPYEVSAPKM